MRKILYFFFIFFLTLFLFDTHAKAQNNTKNVPSTIRGAGGGVVVPQAGTAPKARTQAASPQPPAPPQDGPTYMKRTNANQKYNEEPEDNGYVRSFTTGTKPPADMRKLGAGITVITSEMIEEMKPSSIAEILRIAPGIIITERGTNYVTASIQAAPANQTRVMIDGIPFESPADPDHTVNLSLINLNMNAIERIEIIKNPASISLGYGASGGIINIITKNGEEQDYTAAIYGDMLFNLENKLNGYKAGINLAGSKETIKYGLSYNRIEEIGISQAAEWYGNGEKDGEGSNNANVSFSIMPIKGLSSGIYINYTDFYQELDNAGGNGGDDSRYKMSMENVLFGWNISYNMKEIWEPSLKLIYKYANKRFRNREDTKIYFGNGTYIGQEVAFEFNNNFYIADQFTLSVGAEYIYDSADIKENDFENGQNLQKEIKNKTTDGVNAYIEAKIDLFDAWTTIISARGGVYGEYGYLPTYGISTAYYIEPAGLTLKASFGAGQVVPSIYQRYDPKFGTPELKPEESLTYQAGFTNELLDGKFVWGGSWFENFYKNLIYKDQNEKYQNIGKAHTYGVEASLRINPADFVSIYGTYTWLNAFSLENGKEKIERMPEHSVTGGVIFKTAWRFLLNVGVNYLSERNDTFYNIIGAARPATLKQYYLLNASAYLNITKNFQLYLTGSNLMDTRYESTAGYGTKGLEIALGIRAKL